MTAIIEHMRDQFDMRPSYAAAWFEYLSKIGDTTPPTHISAGGEFALGDRVRKTKGSSWQGRVVGFYSTELTPIGYAVESEREPGSVQIYPETALAKLDATGLTYAHVEKRAGVARGQLYRWRRELVRPRLDLLTCVAQVVGLRLEVVTV